MIQGHGNNLYHYQQGEIRADFSSNIAFNNKSERIIEHLQTQLPLIANYPDPEATQLRELLAEHHQLSANRILVTNGSAEAFYLLAHHLSRHRSCKTLILTPSFAEYEDSCRLYGHELSFAPIHEWAAQDLYDQQSVWLGYPNNPDGTVIAPAEIAAQSASYPHCRFIIDCAYQELTEAAAPLDPPLENEVHIHSLTKSFGIPGIRLGYIIASAPLIAQLEAMRPPWSVNALSLAAGVYIMQHYDELLFCREELMAETRYLQEEIAKLDYLRVHPSSCNFFLCELAHGPTADALQDYLIAEHGILLRHAGNFRGLDARFFRIAAQSREKNDHLIQALQQWNSTTPSSHSHWA